MGREGGGRPGPATGARLYIGDTGSWGGQGGDRDMGDSGSLLQQQDGSTASYIRKVTAT